MTITSNETLTSFYAQDLVRILSGLGEMKIEGEIVEKGIEGVKRRLVKLLKVRQLSFVVFRSSFS